MAPEVGATPSDGVRGSKDRIVEPHVVGRPVPMPPGALFEAEQRKVHTPAEIQNLLWLMDWLMPLPEPLKTPFRNDLQRRQPDKTMPHITLFQELGRQEGSLAQARESVIEALEIRFGEVSADLRERINALDNLRTLKAQLRRAITVPSLDQF